MPLKNILVHVDDSRHCASRLAVAASLAREHEAHLTGVYVLTPPYIPGYMAAQVSAEVLEVQAGLAAEAAAKAEALFREQADAAGVNHEWRTADGYASDAVTMHARYADIVILGQPDPEEEETATTRDLPGEVVLEAGRPVLIVPYAGRFTTIGKTVLVAWNGSRESARAVNDALPLLHGAQSVTVLNINPESGAESDNDAPGADIALHLSRHGIPVEAAPSYGNDIDVGDVLLSRAADLSADLIVMGSKGLSGIREFLIGSVSHKVLPHTDSSVLISPPSPPSPLLPFPLPSLVATRIGARPFSAAMLMP